MIRHAGSGGLPAEPIFPLTVAMIQAAFLAALVTPIRASPLPDAGPQPAPLAAVAVAAITMGADEEDGVAVRLATGPEQENDFAMNRSRHRGMAVLDNGGLVVSG